MSKIIMPPYQWQADLWAAFISQVTSNVLPHALLLTGAAGTGVEKFAASMAHYLLCGSPMEGSACGSCKTCQLFRAGSHPDMLNVAPEEVGKQIKVDQVRQVTEFVYKTAQQGGRKLIKIQPAEAMNINAANSLLKCLEEPAGNTVIILVSLVTSQLLPTIRSRCSKWNLPVPSRKDSVEWLTEMGVVENVEPLLDAAFGGPLLAMDWWQNEHFQQREEMCAQLVAVSSGQLPMSKAVSDWSRLGALDVLSTMLVWVERLIKAVSTGEPVSGTEAWRGLFAQAEKVPLTILFRYRDSLCHRKGQLQANPNLNVALVVEELLLDWKAALAVSNRAVVGQIHL